MSRELKFNLNIEPNALLCPNPTEWISKAYITESDFNNFRLVPGIKYKTKLAELDLGQMTLPFQCDFPTLNAAQLDAMDVDVTSLTVAAQWCQSTLEEAFFSERLAKGSSEMPSDAEFNAYFFEKSAEKVSEEREFRRWQGDVTLVADPNLKLVDGHIKKLKADTTVLDLAFTTITQVNVVEKFTDALLLLPKSVKSKRDDLRFRVSPDVFINYQVATSTGNNTAYVTSPLAPTFLGMQVVVCDGMPSNTIVLSLKDDLLYTFDGTEDLKDFTILDLKKSTGQAFMRARTDLKEGFYHSNGNQIVLHTA